MKRRYTECIGDMRFAGTGTSSYKKILRLIDPFTCLEIFYVKRRGILKRDKQAGYEALYRAD